MSLNSIEGTPKVSADLGAILDGHMYVIDVHLCMVFIEFKTFKAAIDGLLPDDMFLEFQEHLMTNPEAGSTIKGTHGLLRKIRWKLPATGKSGGGKGHLFWKQSEDQNLANLRLPEIGSR